MKTFSAVVLAVCCLVQTEEISTATKHRAKNLKNPFQLKQISKDSKVTKKEEQRAAQSSCCCRAKSFFIGIMNLGASV